MLTKARNFYCKLNSIKSKLTVLMNPNEKSNNCLNLHTTALQQNSLWHTNITVNRVVFIIRTCECCKITGAIILIQLPI